MCMPVMDEYMGWGILMASKMIFVLMLFTCLLLMLVRQRETIKILKEIRDKK